jgi:hypothetical protein
MKILILNAVNLRLLANGPKNINQLFWVNSFMDSKFDYLLFSGQWAN